jgi:hypothetical protein
LVVWAVANRTTTVSTEARYHATFRFFDGVETACCPDHDSCNRYDANNRFGKFSHLVEPGLNWKPTFIDQVRAVNVEAVREL